MQQINPSNQSSTTGVETLVKTVDAEAKQSILSQVARVLERVTLPVAQLAVAPNTTVLQTRDQQLAVAISPAIKTSPADALLILKLPLSTPIHSPQQGLVSLRTSIDQGGSHNLLPVLLKQSSAVIQQTISAAQTQHLLNVLKTSINSPFEIQAQMVQQTQHSVTVKLPHYDNIQIELPLPTALTQNEKSKASSVQENIQRLPQDLLLKITPSSKHQTIEFLTTKTTSASPTGTATQQAPAIRTTIATQSPTADRLLTTQLRDGIQLPAQSIPVTSWLKENLSSSGIQHLAQWSKALPITATVENSKLQLTGARLDIAGVATQPEKALMSALPAKTAQIFSTMNLQADLQAGSQLPKLAINKIPTRDLSHELTKTVSNSVNSTKLTVPENHNVALKTGEKPEFKYIPPEVKANILQYVRTTQRLNIVNTDAQLPNIFEIARTVQQVANTTTAPVIKNITQQLLLGMYSNPLTDSSSVALSKSGTSTEQQTPATNPIADNQQVSNAIKQLFTSPAWLQSPAQLTSPSHSQGFINGLVQLLQVAMLGRHFKQQEDLEQFINRQKSSGGSSAGNTNSFFNNISARQMREFNQLDAQQNLLKQLKTLLASHQQSKLGNLEQALQGQESFYYVLPGLLPEQKSTELLIKREPEREQEANQQSKARHWQLTMKLTVGEQGELLTKAKVSENAISLDIYSSNQQLLQKVGLTLPFLLKRFSLLGINVEEHKLQLGKIPDSLADRPYQILDTQA